VAKTDLFKLLKKNKMMFCGDTDHGMVFIGCDSPAIPARTAGGRFNLFEVL